MKDDFKKTYMDWLYENIEQYKISNSLYQLTLPYLDRNNDFVEIFIEVLDDTSYRISDGSETIEELSLSQFDIFSSERRKKIFHTILASHGVSLSDKNELYINTSKELLAQSKHMLSQCIIKVSDMFSLSRKNIKSLFFEDVRGYLDSKDIRYMANISFGGKSKLISNYDFGIAKSKKAPERIIKVINNFNLDQARNTIFSWTDTVEERQNGSVLYTFIQDYEKNISQIAIEALKEYSIVPVLWSKKDDFTDELVA